MSCRIRFVRKTGSGYPAGASRRRRAPGACAGRSIWRPVKVDEMAQNGGLRPSPYSVFLHEWCRYPTCAEDALYGSWRCRGRGVWPRPENRRLVELPVVTIVTMPMISRTAIAAVTVPRIRDYPLERPRMPCTAPDGAGVPRYGPRSENRCLVELRQRLLRCCPRGADTKGHALPRVAQIRADVRDEGDEVPGSNGRPSVGGSATARQGGSSSPVVCGMSAARTVTPSAAGLGPDRT